VAVPVWRFYEAPGGGSPVERDIQAAFKNDTAGKTFVGGPTISVAADGGCIAP